MSASATKSSFSSLPPPPQNSPNSSSSPGNTNKTMSSYAEAAQPDKPQAAKDAVPPPAPQLVQTTSETEEKSSTPSEKVHLSHEAPPSPSTGPSASGKKTKNPPLPHVEQHHDEKKKHQEKEKIGAKLTRARDIARKTTSDEARKVNQAIQQHPVATTNIILGITGLVACGSLLAERHKAGRLDQRTGIITGISVAIYVLADIVISRKYSSSS